MPETRMLINYVPGEECRVAIVEDGQLEEFHAESSDAISRVGNIYLGRVANVEQSIQAAFVDFGIGENGFLHVSDLHPRYFPGEDEDTAERVGHKTPRRERPPIQHALRRGQEILVQVIKEGVGTKGPTLTSYLSIPGRFLVMMPQMDKVGVSRKVEDEDTRRQMRQILDTLDLPEGFGFILRTAGFDRTKLELKRDLSYLQRLWKDMERRKATGKAPRLLYSESDLLVRTIRDALTNDIDEVVIDNEHALQRAGKFLKIVSPKSRTKLLHYRGKAPIFHAYGMEPQILQMHAREVPLPSGGRLVIDETEALVAIDVNSGRSRDARDAESNAFNTNMEAVDVISRHLRLRDLGGLVILDLIDMRMAKNRKDVEAKFRDRLKRDRAKSTILPISEFGILEMTRQRMRGSHERVHFTDCPTCHARGLVQKPASVAADALRELSAVLEHDKVFRVEMVVSPRVAGELLSQRRKALGRIERASGKTVDVRVSETHAVDRITLYAYDQSGTDIGLDRLNGRHAKPDVVEWDLGPETEDWSSSLADEQAAQQDEPIDEPVLPETDDMGLLTQPGMDEGLDENQQGQSEGNGGGKKRRRRGRGRGRGRGEGSEQGEGGREPAREPGRESGRDSGRGSERAPARGRGPGGRTPAPATVRGPTLARRPDAAMNGPVGGSVGGPGPARAAAMAGAADQGEDVGPVDGDMGLEHGGDGAGVDQHMVDAPMEPGLDQGQDQGHGPDGDAMQPGDGSGEGEGGRRRRRRGRRGRRGGGGMNGGPGQAGEAGHAMSDAGEGGMDGGPDGDARASADRRDAGPMDGEPGGDGAMPQGDGEGSTTGDQEQGGQGPDGEGEGGESGGDPRRRRRRRGGRGRRGGGESGERAPNAEQPAAAATSPTGDRRPPIRTDGRGDHRSEARSDQRSDRGPDRGDARGDGRGDGRGGNRDGGRDGGRGNDRGQPPRVEPQRDQGNAPRPTRQTAPAAVRTAPRPVVVAAPPPPPPGIPAGAKPKSLYGGARRKLAPSEVGKAKARKD